MIQNYNLIRKLYLVNVPTSVRCKLIALNTKYVVEKLQKQARTNVTLKIVNLLE